MTDKTKLEGYKEVAAYAKRKIEENKQALAEQAEIQKTIGDRANKLASMMTREAVRKAFRGISSDPTPEAHKAVNSLRREMITSMRDNVALLNRWVEWESISIEYDEKVLELEGKIQKDEAARKITNFGVPFEVVAENSRALLAKDEIKSRENDTSKMWLTPVVPHYIVNEDKKTVVALLKCEFSGSVRYRGVAKAHPGDKFNVDVGKAIAIRRALGLEDLPVFTGKNHDNKR